MKSKKPALSEKRWNSKFKKLLVYIMIIVTILTSLGIFILKDFGLGYKYYEINEIESIYIGATQEKDFLDKTIENYIEGLKQEGYFVEDYVLTERFINHFTIIPKADIKNDDIRKVITDSLDVSILATKLNLANDETTYYFKTQQECDDFVNSLNEYIEQDSNSEGISENYRKITSQEILDKKIESVKQEKLEKDKKEEEERIAAQLAKQQVKQKSVTSRSATSSRKEVQSIEDTYVESSYSGGAPLASYVYISSPFGMRHGKMHTGTDFAASSGTSVFAWKSGTVIQAGWNGSYGNFIAIQHNDGTVSRYAHLSGYACSSGQTVSQGQTIGYVGSTGNSTGAHLHFEIMIGGSFVNPMNYL